jgi:predicted AlkP superfamily pyrophosphatase or phosphodiesterase
MNHWWKLLSKVAVVLLAVGATGYGRDATPSPRLVLALSVDQMAYDYLPRFANLYQGGFQRLLKQGAVFSNARYRHANTETGPGHAVFLSGRHGSTSGIIANSWYDAYLKREINVVEDPAQRPVGGEGRGASPANFLGFTIGDSLKQKDPASRVVAVSLKDRAAVLMGGRRADAAFWYETAGGNFITSTYYMPSAPAWLTAWNSRRLADSFAVQTWNRIRPDVALYEKYSGPDAVEGEWDRKDTVFPHKLRGTPPNKEYYDDVRRTPFADELVLSVTLEAMKAYQLGQRPSTDLLAVSFSATDVIGHTYGPDSQEIMDQLLRLDLLLERLFQAVETQVGLERTLIVLAGDHGVQPLVEVLQAKGIAARRVLPEELGHPVQKALRDSFPGIPGLIAYMEPPLFYLDERAMEQTGLQRQQVEAVVSRALYATGLVERVFTQDDLLHPPAAADPQWRLFRNSFFQSRSPHVIACPKPYIYVDDRVGGTGHGTPHDYDRHVPIIFLGTGIRPGTYHDPCGPEDIAPTLGLMLGWQFPKEPDSRLLLEMLEVKTGPSLVQ